MMKFLNIPGNGRYDVVEEAEWKSTHDLAYFIIQNGTFEFLDENRELVEDWEIRHNIHEGWSIVCYDNGIDKHCDSIIQVIEFIILILQEREF